jgi:hypothetical protein
LSLLYRGALSRAIHRHAVAIAESFTESEVLRAVRHKLGGTPAAYFTALVECWQSAVYAAQMPGADRIAQLCDEFTPALEPRSI